MAAGAIFAVAAACSSPEGIITPVLPHDPVDEAWKAIDNYEYSFNTKDLALLEETLDQSLVFLLDEEDWDDYNGDGIIETCFQEEYYLQTVSLVFNQYEIIELVLNGSSESPWPGDPSGETLLFDRSYSMKAHNWVGGQQEGWLRVGDVVFLAAPDSAGVWRITQIEDLLESTQ